MAKKKLKQREKQVSADFELGTKKRGRVRIVTYLRMKPGAYLKIIEPRKGGWVQLTAADVERIALEVAKLTDIIRQKAAKTAENGERPTA